MICFAQAAQSKPRLQSSGESGIKTIVLLGGSLAGAESSTDSAQKRAFTFLLNLSSRRILSSLCPWLPRIGRLSAQSRRSEPSWIMAQLWKIFIRFRGPRPYDDSCEIGLTVSVDFDSVVYQKFARTFTVSLQLPGLESRSDLVGCGTCFQIPRKTE